MEVIRQEVRRKSETCDSETEEETKRVDIKYATKNKTTKKKIGKGRKRFIGGEDYYYNETEKQKI